MIIVMGTFRMPTQNLERALPMAEAVVMATRAEDGCFAYSYSRDLFDPEVIHVSEKWRDRAALTAHFHSEHMKTWAAERGDLGLFGRDIRVFETDEGEPV
jgi:quinol monooxygenase YgiN